MFWFFCPLFALLFLGLSLAGLPETVKASRGEGQLGTFIAQHEDCSTIRFTVMCSWTGRYLSDDGSRTLEGVLLDSEAPDRVGERIPTLYEGETDPLVVYLPEESGPLESVALLGAAGLAYLIWWTWSVIRRSRHRSSAIDAGGRGPRAPVSLPPQDSALDPSGEPRHRR
jgi:hypothetical protein